MHYHLLLTEKCNLKCRYCYEKSVNISEFDNGLDKKFKFDFSSPGSLEIDIQKLEEFLKKDEKAVLVFYGGEPLLEIDKIKKIMDRINIPYRLQTNAKLLHLLPSEYTNRIGKILVSIDGNKERTDYNKGDGTFDRIIYNLDFIKKNNYQGEIVARMTISDFPDIFEQIINILKLKRFDSIHWQLDAGFFKSDFNEKKFSAFVKDYNTSITRLINYWINEIKESRLIRLYPFIGIIDSLLKKEKTKLRCGAGHSGYAITTNGKIVACPIMNCIKDFEVGDLDSEPKNLKKFHISGKCKNCNIKDLCGGRCLYWNRTKLWPKKGDELICKTIKHLISELKKQIPIIEDLIEKNKIKKEDFEYEKYFGPEIIP